MKQEIEKVIAEAEAQVVAEVAGKPVSRGQLKEVFAKVCDPKNWKLPINAIVALAPAEVQMLAVAIPFFAGCAAEIFPWPQACVAGKKFYRVMAVGYYEAVGA